jgi:lysophospholipase L1-like esterase
MSDFQRFLESKKDKIVFKRTKVETPPHVTEVAKTVINEEVIPTVTPTSDLPKGYIGAFNYVPDPNFVDEGAEYRNINEGKVYKKVGQLWEVYVQDGKNGQTPRAWPSGGGLGERDVRAIVSENGIPSITTYTKWSTKQRTNPFGNSTKFPRFDAAWNSLVTGSQNASIGFLGDSTTQGIKSGSKPNWGSWPDFFSRRFCQNYGVLRSGYSGLVPTLIDSNNFWKVGAGWTKNYGLGPGKSASLDCPVGNTNTTTWTAPELNMEWDTAEVFVVTASGGGIANVQATGGSVQQVSCSGTSSWGTTSVIVSAASVSRYNTVSITPINNSQHLWVLGVRVYNSDGKVLFFDNQGVGGSQSINWSVSNSGGQFGDMLLKYNTNSLVFLSLGINEHSLDLATYLSRVQIIINNVSTYADVVLLDPFLVGPSNTTTNINLEIKANALSSLTGYAAYVPIYSLMKSRNIPFWTTSTLHPTEEGYSMIADLIYNYLLG